MDAKLRQLQKQVFDEIKEKTAIPDFSCLDCSIDPRIAELRTLVSDTLLTRSSETGIAIDRAALQAMTTDIVSDLAGYGPISTYLADPAVTEIMVNGPHEIFIERGGVLHDTGKRFMDEDHLRRVADRIVSPLGRRLDETQPYVDARLPDGSRVNVVIPPVALNGTLLTVRKFPEQQMTLPDLISSGSLPETAAQFLTACVCGRLNVIVSGGTGTGKTTLLNILARTIPAHERLITIEDAAELRLGRKNLAGMEVRLPDVEGKGRVNARDLVRNALRMRPNRIIVGEVRGPEALDMLQAMNSGHDGSMSTIHANTPRDVLARLETMVLMAGLGLTTDAIRAQISSSVQIIVHLDRFPAGKRCVTKICEIQGMEGNTILLQDLFAWGGSKEAARLQATGLTSRYLDVLKERGCPLPADLFRTVR